MTNGTEQGCRADCSGQSDSPWKPPGSVSSRGKTSGIRFHPSTVNQGIQFRRTDCNDAGLIPARIEFAVKRQRRTAIERDGTAVEMIEHVTAALAGLWIDNCTVEIDGPEPPGMDGSSLEFAQLLLSAGIVEQPAIRPAIALDETVFVGEPQDESEITYRPAEGRRLSIEYRLDYGRGRQFLPRRTRSRRRRKPFCATWPLPAPSSWKRKPRPCEPPDTGADHRP